MLDKLKGIFDGKEHLTFAEFEEATKGMKLIDLEDGEYVGKDKFKALEKAKNGEIGDLTAKLEEATKAKAEPGSDDETKKLVESLQKSLEEATKRIDASDAKATRLEREKAVADVVKNPKLAKLALIEAESLVDEDTDFGAALKRVIDSDPEYTQAPASGIGTKVGTGKPAGGDPEGSDLIAAIDKGFGEEADTKE